MVYSFIFALALILLGYTTRTAIRQRDDLARMAAEMRAEMEEARVLQDLLLKVPPRLHGVDIVARVTPARILGGDTVKVAEGPDGTVAVLVADVSGHGSPAALAGAVLVGMLENAPGRYTSPAQVLKHLNDRLHGQLQGEKFVTIFYGLIDTQRGILRYANAGHEPPLLVVRGHIQELDPTGMVVGILPNESYEEPVVEFPADALLVCYTDGISDIGLVAADERSSLRGGFLDTERMPLQDMADQIITRGHRGEKLDDTTVVLVRRTPPATQHVC